MSDPTTKPEDELAGTEQPFVQHLIELRDRLIKAVIAVAVFAIALSLYPGPGPLYDILAAPLVAQLPVGATMIATSVISPFLVPLKILLMAAFLLALPVVLYQMWAFVAPGLCSRWWCRAPFCSFWAWRFATFLCLDRCSPLSKALPPKASRLRLTSRPISALF